MRSAAALLSCALIGNASAAIALDGRVVVKGAGTPVPDAEVSIVGRPGSVRTDGEGRFAWTPTPVPPFDVLVMLPGGHFVPVIRVERLPKSALTLEVVWTLSEAVTVSGGIAGGLEGAPANGTTLLTARDLGARAPANLGQTVENVAGASTVSEGQAGVPALRGLARGRTLVLIDGARVTAERRVGPSATYLDPASVAAVEVSRGPGSVAYGSDAFGGVLHVRTRRATPGAPLGGRIEGTIGAGVPQQRAAVELTRGFARGGVLLQAHVRNFEDWTSPRGKVPNSGAEDRGVLLRFDHLLGRGLVSAGVQSDFGRDIERPRNNSEAVRFFYPREDSHRFTLGWERSATEGWTRLGVNAFAGRYAVVTDQDRAADAEPRSVERVDVSANDFQVRTFAERPMGSTRLEAGVDVHGRHGLEALDIGLLYDAAGALERTTTNVSIEDARRIDAGVYVGLEAPLRDRVLIAAGIRGDRVASRNRGGYFGDRDARNRAASGFAAVTAGPFRGLSVTAQVARGFRDPVLSDRYFRGPTGRGFITGNPDLVPESSLQVDGAARLSRGRWRAALYGYHYRIDDLVERYQTDTDTFFFRNRGRARVRGAEAEVQASLPARLSLDLSAHLIRGRALDDGTPLDDVPPPTVTARLRREFERGSLWVRTALYDRLAHPGPTEQARPGYALLDAGAAARLGSRVEVHVVGRNLLDESYLASPDARATLAPGRSGTITVSTTF